MFFVRETSGRGLTSPRRPPIIVKRLRRKSTLKITKLCKVNPLKRAAVFMLVILIVLPLPVVCLSGPTHINNKGVAMPKENTASVFVEQELAKGSKPNRLIHEKSPYLLQHAFNPVDWYPWGEEAFSRARQEDKPIFLSIGYSTCHWCHVMAHESFEDPEVAALLNRYFICIKVDREERPDIDQLYMAVTQAMTGGGGWPMSIFLTPDRKPIYAGTYFPPQARHGLPGFTTLLTSVNEAWRNNREKILQSADRITEALQQEAKKHAATDLSAEMLNRAYTQMASSYDAEFGGFGGAPKFPRPVVYNFLLRYHHRFKEKKALQMVLTTLRKMAAGGMYDHIGGGFHRYSVDGQWRVPHFEKMLYDQAQLAISYLEAFQVSHDPFYASVAKDVFDYVGREMTGPEGGFYSAEDADSAEPDNSGKKGEGAFYVWPQAELAKLLGADAPLFNYHYGVKSGGNALHDPHGEFSGRNILYVAKTLEETAAQFDTTVERVDAVLRAARQKLFEARRMRPRPHLDDKVITSWNGQMISAYARAYRVLGEKRYHAAAAKAADFIMTRLYDPDARTLMRRYRDGEAGLEAHLDDYAFFINGLLDLYEASFESRWLTHAILLTERELELFEDKKGGGFFDTSGRDKTVLLRMKSDYDGAEPTGNSIAALNLLRLGRMLHKEEWSEKGARTITSFADSIKGYPSIMPQMLVALDFYLDKPRQLVVAGKRGDQQTARLLAEVQKRFLPCTVFLFADGSEGEEGPLAGQLPFLSEMKMLDGRPTVYLCENFVCKLPITTVEKLSEALDR